MQDMLVPIFGENGAVIAQYVITLAVVLALVALVVWAIRHYGGGVSRPAQRGRLPRLAIVDTLAVDNKRKLVLVRRDNVEHLVLIGGPSDVVVEPSIVRQRVAQRPGLATPMRAPTAAAAPPPPPPTPAVEPAADAPRVVPARHPLAGAETTEATIPFPPRRSPIRTSERLSVSRRDTMRASASLAPEFRSEAALARRPAAPLVDEEPEPVVVETELQRESLARSLRTVEPEPVPVEEPVEEAVPGYPPEAEEPQDSVSAFAPPAPERRAIAMPAAGESNGPSEAVEVPSAPPTAAMEPPESAAQPAQVSDLEKEMARLLDEISTTRRD